MQQTGFFWHVRHRILMEWCYGCNEHAEFIRTTKPSDEQELRLRLFQPVKGQLPQEVVEARETYDEAGKTYDEAWKACNKARETYDEAMKAYIKARKAYIKARKAYIKARKANLEAREAYDGARKANLEAEKAYDEAWKAYYVEALLNHKDEIEALHAQECLNCLWDGETIFPAA